MLDLLTGEKTRFTRIAVACPHLGESLLQNGQISAMSAEFSSRPHRTPVLFGRNATVASGGSAIVERLLLWAFIAGLAWCPFWFGSNVLLAWGINAVLFPGLVAHLRIVAAVKRRTPPRGDPADQSTGCAVYRRRALDLGSECDMDARVVASSDMANDCGRAGQAG